MIVFNIVKANLLSANREQHWAPKAEVVKTLRGMSKSSHRNAIHTGARTFQRARLVVWIAWPDGRRRDRQNITPTIKALVDGAVDAGLIPDDDDKHLDGPDLRTDVQRCDKKYAARLEFCWTEPEDVAA